MTSIPQHLRYTPPKVESIVGNVTSKYRTITPKPNFDDIVAQQIRKLRDADPLPPRNEAYASVRSRYQDPYTPRSVPDSNDRANIPFYETHEYKQYKSTSPVVNVAPRFMEISPPNDAKRKSVIEGKRSEITERYGRPNFAVSRVKLKSFQEMQPAKPTTSRPHSPAAKNAVSVVMQWVKNGVAIPRDRVVEVSPLKPRTEKRPFYGAGGAGGGSFEKRHTSPTRKALVEVEDKVAQYTTTMQKARAATPPRVAALISARRQLAAFDAQPPVARVLTPGKRVPSPVRRIPSPVRVP